MRKEEERVGWKVAEEWLLRELAADSCNILREEIGKSVSCEVSSQSRGR